MPNFESAGRTGELAAVIMAAGKGTRMKSPETAKVMFPIGGVPMIQHVVTRARESGADRVIAVVGHNRESVRDFLARECGASIEFADQIEQLGTGHAIMQAMPLLDGYSGDVLVLSGDVPLLRTETILALAKVHHGSGAVATVLTVHTQDPTGYGRIIRNDAGLVEKIVEQKDASEEERSVNEINSGIYIFHASELRDALAHLRSDNAQNEYYLTDVFAWFREHRMPVAAYIAPDFQEIQGINTLEQLAEVNERFIEREGVER